MTQPSALQSLWDHLSSAATHSPIGGGGLARAYYRLRGYSDQDIDRAIAAHDTDVAHRDAQSNDIGHKAASLVGGLLGGVDPTYAIGGGAGLARRALIQGAVQAPASAVRQGINIQTGMQKHFSPKQVVEDAADAVAGTALLEGGGKVIGKLARVAKDRFSPPKTMTDADLQGPDDLGQPSIVEDEMPSPAEQSRIIQHFKPKDEPTPPSPAHELTDADLQPPVEAPVEAPPPQAPPAELTDADLQPPVEQTPADPIADVTPAKPTTAADMAAPVDEPVPAPANDDEALANQGRAHGPWEEIPSDEEGVHHLNYTANDGQKVNFIRMGIEPDGTAEISIDPFSKAANRIGPSEIRQAMYHLQDMYPEIKRFGGYRRSGAGAGRVQEITPPARNVLTDEAGSVTPPQWLSDLFQGKNNRPDIGDVPPEDMPPEQRLAEALKMATPLRGDQEALYTKERAKRFEAARKAGYAGSGEAGYHNELSKLKGALPTVPQRESIRDNFSQDERDSLFDQIGNSRDISYTDSLHARAGLSKLLHPDGVVEPTNSELDVLRKVFPDAANAVTPKDQAYLAPMANILGVVRSIKTIGDLGVAFRQAIPLVGTKEFWTSIPEIFKGVASEDMYQRSMDAIKQLPDFKHMEGRVAFTDLGGNLTNREEFASSKLAEHIPLVRRTARGYTAYLNVVRAATFQRLVDVARKLGANVNSAYLDHIGDFVNVMTGRGSLGTHGNKAAPVLAAGFFSPRLQASRINLLTKPLDPRTYLKLPPQLQKEYLKGLVAYTGYIIATLGTAKALGAEVSDDPKATDFGRIKIKDTRFDNSGGFQPYIRFIAQQISDEKTTASGHVYKFGDGFGHQTRLDSALDFAETKASPVAGAVMDEMRGKDLMDPKDITGETHAWNEKSLKNPALNLVIPMGLSAYLEARSDYGNDSPIPYAAGLASTFGIGTDTYLPHQKKSKPGRNPFSGGGGSNPFKAGNAKGPF